jgi:murein DD-endopeptidase MepM/ murein hydrolase activator NlpD
MKATRAVIFLAVAALILTVAGVSASAKAQSSGDALGAVEGTWAGVLAGQLHLVVTIEKSSAGELGGTLNSVDQHSVLALGKVTLKGTSVHFEVPRVGGEYDGKLNKDGTKISGTWVQAGGSPLPLDLARTAAASMGSSAPATAKPNAPAEHTPKPIAPMLNTFVPEPPVAFKADGRWNLVYELHIANMDRWDCVFTGIDAISGDPSAKTLASYSGTALDGVFSRPGRPQTEHPAKLAPGEFGVAFLWVTADRLEDIPAFIEHRVTAKIGDYPEAMTVITPRVAVDKTPVVVIRTPLAADNLVAANGPSNTSPHRRALIPVNGRAWISQRYAIDWVEVYPDGKTYQGDPLDNKNYKIYGSEIHSVADGVVTETKDGLPQNVPNAEKMAVPIDFETIGGNHVIVDIGGGRFAFYAHMQPGSLRVKVGDKVKTGDVLGLVGNTGNSSEPHLHFDLCDASAMLACEGVPYALATFTVTGKTGEGGKVTPLAPADRRTLEIPAENEIVTLKF